MTRVLARVPRPTARAWGLLGVVVASSTLGIVLGLAELTLFATAAAIALVLGFFVTLRPRRWPECQRTISPPRLRAESDGLLRLELHNHNPKSSSTVICKNPFGTRRSGRPFRVKRLEPGDSYVVERLIRISNRGRVHIEATTLFVTDPLGLWTRSGQATPGTDLLVWPRVDTIPPIEVSEAGGMEPIAANRRSNRPTGELYGLREYVLGDDPRMIHWKSVARTNTLVVREDAALGRASICVVLDNRKGSMSATDFEDAASATISIAAAAASRGSEVRLITLDGFDSGAGRGEAHFVAIGDRLAQVLQFRDEVLVDQFLSLLAADNGGHLPSNSVVVSGTLASTDRFAAMTRVTMPMALFGKELTGAPSRDRPTCVVDPLTKFSDAWTTYCKSWARR